MDLVFVESQDDLTGKIIPVKISWTGPWTLIGTIAG
jgi:tRNA-2-methylthio-N6-dimethylallyladenosine synthase